VTDRGTTETVNDEGNTPAGAVDEPAPTIENSETIQAEEDLRETSTHTKIGVIPSGYGTIGGFAPDAGVRSNFDDRPPDEET
jgi:hypothetical protein